jgi:hypothetical protein
MTFSKWLDTLVSEKGLDREHLFEKEGPSGLNIIPLGVVLDAIKSAPAHEQRGIKTMLVKIDFVNGSVLKYFEHLAGALAQ